VQTLNLPGAEPPRQRGPRAAACPAARGRRRRDLVAGSLFSGYLGDPSRCPSGGPAATSAASTTTGFVHLSGRKKHLLITAYGRNVSPEWVETALRSQPAVLQAVVFGDGQPALSAVLWPTRPGADLQAAVDAANATLPDYARIARWTAAAPPSTPAPAWPPPMAARNAAPSRRCMPIDLQTA
jgi:long-chain acyl-CoA synthetase